MIDNDKSFPDRDAKARDKEWWNALEDFEKKWTEKRKKERIEEAKKIQEGEKEYQRFSQSPKVLTPVKDIKTVLAAHSSEPSLGKMRLRSMKSFDESPPFRLEGIIYDPKNLLNHPISILPKIEPEKKEKAHEYLAYSLRKAMEFQTDEKIHIILQASDSQEFFIKALKGAEFVPLCRVFVPSCDHIEIEIQKSSFPYIHGYSFDIEKIIYNYLLWLETFLVSPNSFPKK